jgi:uncharacterized protein YjiS (DUF1127 family)
MSILNLLIAPGRAIAERQRRERAYAELMALDDHSLADIGVRRSQIRALVEGADAGQAEAARGAEEPSFWSANNRLIGPSSRPNL